MLLVRLAALGDLDRWFPVVVWAGAEHVYVIPYGVLTAAAGSAALDQEVEQLARAAEWPVSPAIPWNAFGPRALRDMLLAQESGYLVLRDGTAVVQVLEQRPLDGWSFRPLIKLPDLRLSFRADRPDPLVPATSTLPSTGRQIVCWIDGLAPHDPLAPRGLYNLLCDVVPPPDAAPAPQQGRGSAREVVAVSVVLDALNFTLYGVDRQMLIVPAYVGASKNRVLFTIEAPDLGPASLEVAFWLEDLLVQRHTRSFRIGDSSDPVPALRIHGSSLDSAIAQRVVR